MNMQDLRIQLTKKFPQFLKADDTELDDIMDAMNGYSDTDLAAIWEEFRDTYSAGYAPRRAVFVKLAKELRVFKVFTSANARYEFVCYCCGKRFPLDEVTCPGCGNRDKAWRAVIAFGAERMGRLKSEVDAANEHRKNSVYPRNPSNDEKTNREQAAFILHARQAGPRIARDDESGIR